MMNATLREMLHVRLDEECVATHIGLSVAVLLMAGAAFGDVVTFVRGGDPDHPAELTATANWSPAPPTADDVIEINSGTLGTNRLTLASDLAVAGLSVKNPTQLLTIAPADATSDPLPRLKLGACGITNATSQSSSHGLSFTVPLETTAAQTWFCGKQIFKTATPVYGTEDLVIMRSYAVTHTKAPQYAGKITYRLSLYDWNQKVNLQEAAPWATSVVCVVDSEAGGGGYWQPTFAISGSWSFSDIFPEGSSYKATPWSVQTVLVNGGGTATMAEDALSRMSFSSADSSHVRGTLNLVGGLLQPGAMFVVSGGAKVQQTGGGVYLAANKHMRLGSHNHDSYSAVSYILDDGVFTNYTMAVGGMVSMNWYTYQNGIARFRMNGGRLVILPNGHSYAAAQALVLSGIEQSDATRRNAPGVFTQTGGAADVARVSFGETGAGYKNTTGFGMLDLQGGVFRLGTGNFVAANSWNNGATESSKSNATYRVRLAGGELSVAASTGKVQIEVGCGEAPSVFSNAAAHVVTAPVWGRGALRKRGAGNLTLRDAARFAGSLSVEQGAVSVGAFADPTPTGTCPAAKVSLRAEDITGIADGGAVASWPTQDRSASAGAAWQSASPTLVKGGFAGHDAVRFTAASKQALALPNANIPWVGNKSFACAVVFRTRTKGPDSNWDIYGFANRGRGILSTAADSDGTHGTMFLSFTSDGSIACRYNASDNVTETGRGNYNVNPRKPCDLDDGEPHVAIFSADETALKLRTMVDGHFTEQASTLSGALNSTRALFIGGMNGSEAGRYFDGDIAEIRLFDVALSWSDMKALTEEWCAKYGTRPLTGAVFADGDAPGSGLGVTNVTVAAGATLALPTGETAGYTVSPTRTLANAGTVSGTLALADGARLPFGWTDEPSAFGTVKAAGTVTIDVSGIPLGHASRKALFTYETLEAADATFVLTGANVDPKFDRLVFKDGTCWFRSQRGLNVIVR